MTPQPPALRLVTRAQRVPARALPFGLRAWSLDASAIAVLLEADANELDEITIASQVPHARDLAPRTPVFVLGRAMRDSARVRWLSFLRSGALEVGRAPRCGALLMRGFVGLGAGIDDTSGADLVWGFSSPC